MTFSLVYKNLTVKMDEQEHTYIPGADTAPNLMGRISLRKGWLVRGPGQSPGRRRQRAAGENFFEDRLG